jgi:hypothetical protein
MGEVGANSTAAIAIWSTWAAVNAMMILLLLVPRCTRLFSDRVRTLIRLGVAWFYAVSSITLVVLLGLDNGPARYTVVKEDCWNLLIAIGLYLGHGFWAWTCILRTICAHTKVFLRWRQIRGRKMMKTVQTELATVQAHAQALAAAPPAVVPAPPIDAVGPLGSAYVQAIRAGHADAVRDIGFMGTFFGPTAANPALPPHIVEAAQDGLYHAQGGESGWVGGLSIEEQDKLFNVALGLMVAVQTLHCTFFGFLAYADVVRAIG